jgi:energy-coupling factor transport system ATP-binding protein
MDEIINEFAKKVNMVEFLDSEPTKLSGGQKQRVAIAGVLAMAPEIMIFDESTSMLDPQGKNEINEVIRELHAKTKMTLVSITHDIEEVTKSDFVIVMNNGQIVMNGKPDEIMMREKELLKSNLDLPFSLKIIKELEKNKIKLNKSVTLEGLVDELCQLNSTK